MEKEIITEAMIIEALESLQRKGVLTYDLAPSDNGSENVVAVDFTESIFNTTH